MSLPLRLPDRKAYLGDDLIIPPIKLPKFLSQMPDSEFSCGVSVHSQYAKSGVTSDIAIVTIEDGFVFPPPVFYEELDSLTPGIYKYTVTLNQGNVFFFTIAEGNVHLFSQSHEPIIPV